MNWYEARPLHGKRVVVTRARAQAAEFVSALEEAGADVCVFPTIRVIGPADPVPLREAIRRLHVYDWIVLTSVNGVERFWAALEAEGHDARALGGTHVACVGPATAAALELHGVRPDLVPAKYDAESLLDALAKEVGGVGGGVAGKRMLLPVAAAARPVLEEGLAARGVLVDRVEAYRTVPDTEDAQVMRQRLEAGKIDVITFTSPSTLANFVQVVGPALGRAVIAVIGPVTADAARRHGVPVDIVAREQTVPGLVEALLRHFGQGS